MKLGIVKKVYSNRFDAVSSTYFSAYLNDYRIYGDKPYGIFDFDEEFDLTDTDHEVEIWRTKRKPETDYEIRFAYKIDGKPCGYWADFVFSKPQNAIVKWSSFKARLRDTVNN